MQKPFKVFSLLFIALALLAAISFIYPREGITIGDSTTLTFPSLTDLFLPDTSGVKHINELFSRDVLAKMGVSDTPTLVDTATADTIAQPLDSASNKIDTTIRLVTIKNIEANLPSIDLEYPDSGTVTLHNFFDALTTIKSNSAPIRVLHYGDSQIEVDRITSRLRSKLQQQFGGGGYGFLTMESAEQSYQLNISSTNLWDTRKIKNKNDRSKKNFGPFFSSARIGIAETAKKNEGSITISRSNLGRVIRRFSLMFMPTSPLLLETKADDSILFADIIPPSENPQLVTVELPPSTKTIRVKMQADVSPLIFGLGFDQSRGIAVDNIPIRGSSGLEFTRENGKLLAASYKMLNVKLLLLEFGVNVVPNVVKSYTYYEEALYQQLVFLRRVAPNASIILIGVSDMSRNNNGRMVSYPNIEKIRDAQKRAAFRAGCAFWDCYRAMGGENAMPAWVNAQPPLANKDYIHFTPTGANLIAEIFYKALMKDYQKYCATQKTTKQ
ncbi:MAG TPA: hypothetical protein VMW01_01680 [Williamwhitmania sp.]|nr:hypothetical protein [Williamwhitmania sp.]